MPKTISTVTMKPSGAAAEETAVMRKRLEELPGRRILFCAAGIRACLFPLIKRRSSAGSKERRCQGTGKKSETGLP